MKVKAAHQQQHAYPAGVSDARLDGLQRVDYFENSRRATYVQQEYAIQNPLECAGYGPYFWGLTTSDGPGWITRRLDGIDRSFVDYIARGAPYGADDGTVAPWAVLPFAPEIALPTVRHFQDVYPAITGEYCFRCSFNRSFPNATDADAGWTSTYHFGINLGPVVLMCENHRSGLSWRLMRGCGYVVAGLRRAGFTNGWL